METLTFIGMRGGARLYEFTPEDGEPRRFIVSAAQVAVAGNVVEPLQDALARERIRALADAV